MCQLWGCGGAGRDCGALCLYRWRYWGGIKKIRIRSSKFQIENQMPKCRKGAVLCAASLLRFCSISDIIFSVWKENGTMHDIWNPWHGCRKCSEGCENCYMYFLDRMRGRNRAVSTGQRTASAIRCPETGRESIR